MESPLGIAFHNLQLSPAIEAELRKHVDKIEHRFRRLTGSRVSGEKLHNQHRSGNLFELHITLSVPGHGRDLAVSRPRSAHASASPIRTSMFRSATPSLPPNVSSKRSSAACARTSRLRAPLP